MERDFCMITISYSISDNLGIKIRKRECLIFHLDMVYSYS